jgi:ribonucleotide reductase alpha subunit
MSEKKITREEAIELSKEYFNGDELAASVFVDKYALKDNDGNLLESTPTEMHHRLAKEFARIDLKYPNPMSEEEYFDAMDKFQKIIPQGSPMSGIGNDNQTISISNCFVIGAPKDSYGGIMKADEELVQLMKRRAGVGLDVSHIRPKGLATRNAAKTTDGIAVFMERFSNSCREVAQGGRRGALMLSISVNHPEVETFITIKNDKTKVTGANISIRINDEFMEAVKADGYYEQRWPVDSDSPKIKRSVKAKQIWEKIIHNAWASAEPGLLFWDTVHKNGPADQYPEFKSVSTNPCFAGEETVLTNKGYSSFKYLAENSPDQNIHTDNRITFVGTSENEKWKIDNKESGTTIRPANVFLTQKNVDVYKLSFDNGVEIKCTEDHHFATSEGMVMAKDLKPNHKILVPKIEMKESIVGKEPESIDEICAFLMGLIAGDGTFYDHRVMIDLWGSDIERMTLKIKSYIELLYKDYEYIESELNTSWRAREGADRVSPYCVSNIPKENKIRFNSTFLYHYLNKKYGFNKETKFKVPTFVMENASTNIGKYYLVGLYYADGSIQGKVGRGFSVRLPQSNEPMLREVQKLTHANGILTKLHLRRDAFRKVIKGVEYDIKPQYELITNNGGLHSFIETIGFFGHDTKTPKCEKIYNEYPRKYNPKHYTKFKSYEYVGVEDVYCLREDVTRSCIVNGISARRCGEITISEYDSCRLIAMNLLGFVDNKYTENATFNHSEFKKYAKIGQRMMDNIIDLELEKIDSILSKIDSDPEEEDVKKTERDLWVKIRTACERGRRTGLGVTALGDAIAALGVKYGSPESVGLVEEMYKALELAAYESSIDMAEERGSFPIYDHSIEVGHDFLSRVISSLSEEYQEKYKQYGRRNIALTTTAPAGSVSIMTQTSSGIEPVFMLSYDRRKKINPSEEGVRVDYVDGMGDKWQVYKVYHHELKKWMEVTGETDETKSPWYGGTANDIDWVTSVDMQAAAQRWVDHSISKTCNLPKDVDEKTVADVYMRAWETGCKGFTVYRDGCRDGVLVSSTEKKEDVVENKFVEVSAPKRPEHMECDIFQVKISGENWTIFIGLFEGKPFEIFGGLSKYISISKKVTKGTLVRNPKKKGQTRAIYDLHYGDESEPTIVKDVVKTFENPTQGEFTRILSLSLRHGAPVKYVVEQLQKDEESGLYSFSKVIARVLKNYIKDNTKVTGKTCPSCGGSNLVYQEGCSVCLDCSASRCG